MRSPLAPRMTTVSDSRPSYMFVWYIHTPSCFREIVMSFSRWYLRVQGSGPRGTRRRLAGDYIATNLHRNQSQISVRESVGKGKSRGTVVAPTRQERP